MLSMTLTMFFKFHIKLALSNSTTIETMDKKGINKSNYNKGALKNWEQIFGRNSCFWLLPMTGESGKPIGDGVAWNLAITIDIDEIPDEGSEKRNSSTMNDKGKRRESEENKNKEPSTAPDSIGNRIEMAKGYYRPETKQNSGKIEEKITEDALLSPEY